MLTSSRIWALREPPHGVPSWAGRGSNPRPSDYESPALTTELPARPEATGPAGSYRPDRRPPPAQVVPSPTTSDYPLVRS